MQKQEGNGKPILLPPSPRESCVLDAMTLASGVAHPAVPFFLFEQNPRNRKENARSQCLKQLRTRKTRSRRRRRKRRKMTSPREPPRDRPPDRRLRGNGAAGASGDFTGVSVRRQLGASRDCPLTHLCRSLSSFLHLPSAESTCSQPADLPVLGEPVFVLNHYRGSLRNRSQV